MKCQDIINEFHHEIVVYSANLITEPEEDRLSAPNPELVQLIAWNVGIAFIVNLLASCGYDYLKSKFISKSDQMRSLSTIQEKFMEVDPSIQGKITKDKLQNTFRNSENEMTSILLKYGLSKRKIDKVLKNIERTLSNKISD